MNTDLKEFVIGQIHFCLSQIKNPEERLNILKEIMPGSTKDKVNFEFQKKKIETSLNSKDRFKIYGKKRLNK